MYEKKLIGGYFRRGHFSGTVVRRYGFNVFARMAPNSMDETVSLRLRLLRVLIGGRKPGQDRCKGLKVVK